MGRKDEVDSKMEGGNLVDCMLAAGVSVIRDYILPQEAITVAGMLEAFELCASVVVTPFGRVLELQTAT